MYFKKILTILIISVMIAVIFAACKDDEDDDTQPTTTTATTTVSDGEITPVPVVQESDEMARILPNLPDMNWGEYTFKVLTLEWEESSELAIWQSRDIAAEEETGDPINDAVYRRNRTLEEKYNFTVKQVFPANLTAPASISMSNPAGDGSSFLTFIRTAIAAGDNYFDAVSMPFAILPIAAQEGLFIDLFDLYYLDFEKPWWNQNAVKSFSILNKLFFTIGDFTLVNRDTISVMLFNKQLIADLQLENPYELVRNGEWTLRKLSEMARAAAADLNGNGTMDLDNDRFGFISSTFSDWALRTGAGVRFADIDADGLPFLIFGREIDYSATYAVHDIMNADFTWNVWNDINYRNHRVSRPERVFTEDRGLFMGATVRTIENLRGAETDFGILPMPWFDENQREWYLDPMGGFGSAMAIPIFHDFDALDKIGFMLEAISAESMYTIIPAHHDVQLHGKFIRDEESSEMLDIIFSSLVWDTGMFYGWGGFDITGAAASGRVASVWERNLGRTESAMQATVNAFEHLD